MIDQPASCIIDGFELRLHCPTSVDELQDLVRDARCSSQAVYPIGGETQLEFGNPPHKEGFAVRTAALSNVVDYPARDMTITVQAGITIAELQEMLGKEKQRLPVDIPNADRATLGGVIATNVSGCRRYGCGTLRDYVIGISVINDEGQQVKAGGRVVKNVAGYDLCKLMIGSFGTLGIVSQVTLKVIPVPEQSGVVLLNCDLDSLPALLERIHESQTRPVAVEVLNPETTEYMRVQGLAELPEKTWLAVVGLEGNAESVNWQVQQLVKEVNADYSLEARIGPTALPVWKALESFPGLHSSGISWKISTLPSRVAELCSALSKLSEPFLLQTHAGNGILRVYFPDIADMESADHMVEKIRGKLESNGSLVVTSCPTDWKKNISVWGPARDSIKVMQRIKESLDPQRVFNPGRFVQGI